MVTRIDFSRVVATCRQKLCPWTPRLRKQADRYGMCALVFLASLVLGAFGLPFVRQFPEWVHALFAHLHPMQRGAFIFALCAVFAVLHFKLFEPRWRHLRHWRRQPPLWFASLLGFAAVAGLDLVVGLSPGRYDAAAWEWLVYGAGSFGAVALWRWASDSPPLTPAGEQLASTRTPEPKDLDTTALLKWLESDKPSEHDYFGGQHVADRIADLLQSGVRSIGIAGRFGTGKSTIVNWVARKIERDAAQHSPRLVLSRHSCWGFRTSADALHAMLADALATVGREIDTFSVRSLPESYRQAFFSGHDAVDRASRLLFGQTDPLDQFRTLDDLLKSMDARLVFVVEDLDRNDSRTFDIQEVLGFLFQLKDFSQLAFILTGGLRATPSIDFSKLCDHIELMPDIDAEHSSSIIATLRLHCLGPKFPHKLSTSCDTDPWTPPLWSYLTVSAELKPPAALARLLRTPRVLRRALSRTLRAWEALVGEVEWDHLLALNALREGAPEAFSFLLHNRDRLRPTGSESDHDDTRESRVIELLVSEWRSIVNDVDWDPRAARELIDFLFPAAPYWFGETRIRDGGPQRGLGVARYWLRAVSEAIDPSDVRDQVVLEDLSDWIASPSAESALIRGMCSNGNYLSVVETVGRELFKGSPQRVLTLCENVFASILKRDGSNASDDSDGFVDVWAFAIKHIPRSSGNREWLERQLGDAARVSLEFVNALWQYCGVGEYSIIELADQPPVRRHIHGVLKQVLSEPGGDRILDVDRPLALHEVIYDASTIGERAFVGPVEWCELAPSLLKYVEDRSEAVSVALCGLISPAAQTRKSDVVVDLETVNAFFQHDAGRAVELLGSMSAVLRRRGVDWAVVVIDSLRSRWNAPC